MSKKEIVEKNSKNDINTKTMKKYLLLFLICGIAMILTIYFCKLYTVYDEYQKEIPVIRGSLSEITHDDLEHYIIDTPSVVVYMCTSRDEICRSFEKKLKKYIEKNEINDEMIYLNLSDIDKDYFVTEFNKKYHYKTKLSNSFPAFVYFENGNIESLLQSKKDEKMTISKLKNYLDLVWLEEEKSKDDENIPIESDNNE